MSPSLKIQGSLGTPSFGVLTITKTLTQDYPRNIILDKTIMMPPTTTAISEPQHTDSASREPRSLVSRSQHKPLTDSPFVFYTQQITHDGIFLYLYTKAKTGSKVPTTKNFGNKRIFMLYRSLYKRTLKLSFLL